VFNSMISDMLNYLSFAFPTLQCAHHPADSADHSDRNVTTAR
jgi:hypothetical protein